MTQIVTIMGAENLDDHKDFLNKAGLKHVSEGVWEWAEDREAGASFVSHNVHFRSLNSCNLCSSWRNPEDWSLDLFPIHGFFFFFLHSSRLSFTRTLKGRRLYTGFLCWKFSVPLPSVMTYWACLDHERHTKWYPLPQCSAPLFFRDLLSLALAPAVRLGDLLPSHPPFLFWAETRCSSKSWIWFDSRSRIDSNICFSYLFPSFSLFSSDPMSKSFLWLISTCWANTSSWNIYSTRAFKEHGSKRLISFE